MRWPPSGALAGDEGHGDGDRADDGGEGAGCGQGKEERLVHAGNALVGAGGSADDGLPAAVVAVGAILAEAGEGAVDEAGVGPGGLVPYAQPVGDAGAEVFDEDISPADEFLGVVEPVRALQVELHGTLAAVPGGKGGLGAGRVAAGAFDLDDIRALLGEEHAEQRAGDVLSELDDPDAAESALGLGGRFDWWS